MSNTAVSEDSMVSNGIPAKLSETEITADIAELQKELAKLARTPKHGAKIAESVRALLFRLSFFVNAIQQKLDTTTEAFGTVGTQLRGTTTEMETNIGDMQTKLNRLGARYGIKPAAKPQVVLGTEPEPNEKDGSVVLMYGALDDPLNHSFEHPLKVGDLTFSCVLQAYLYILSKYHGRDDMAATVKGAVLARLGSFTGFQQSQTSIAWEDRLMDVLTSLLMLKAEQCPALVEKLRTTKPGATFGYCGSDKFWTTGKSRIAPGRSEPDKWPGKNFHGQVMTQFADKFLKDSLPKEPPFDLARYCAFEGVHPEEGKKILVIADKYLAGFQGTDTTEVIINHAFRASTGDHSILKTLQGQETINEKFCAIFLFFGSNEGGRDPDEVETGYAAILDHVKDNITIPVYMTNILPRADSFAEKLKASNYAVSTVLKRYEGIHFLDIFNRMMEFKNWKNLLTDNGYVYSDDGKLKIYEFFLEFAPIVNMKPPNRPAFLNQKSNPNRVQQARVGGPPSKRARGSTFQAPGGFMQRPQAPSSMMGPARYNGPGPRLRGAGGRGMMPQRGRGGTMWPQRIGGPMNASANAFTGIAATGGFGRGAGPRHSYYSGQIPNYGAYY